MFNPSDHPIAAKGNRIKNHRTGQYEVHDTRWVPAPHRVSDYIPQDNDTQVEFRRLCNLGYEPLDAVVLILKHLSGS